MSDAILLRYNEIALKGENRGWFEDKLAANASRQIKRSLEPAPPVEVQHLRGRVLLKTEWSDRTRDVLARVFGVSSFSPIRIIPTDKKVIFDTALEEFSKSVERSGLPQSFRVKTRRSDKALPETSMELDRQIGALICEHYPELPVALKQPDRILEVEIHFKSSFVSVERTKGIAGLPVGTNGHLLCLISGGLDSPVAGIQMMKRGAQVSFIHFYGAPFVGTEALHKVEDLVRVMNRYQPGRATLYVVPFGKIQEKIALVTNPKMRTILYRRMMIRIANQVAVRIKAQALVTGESLGQVASQTLENLSSIDQVSAMPILRPLIGLDKDEIIELSQKWDTYDTSIQPAADCCTLFADRHPTLRANPGSIELQEGQFSIDQLVQEALDSIEIKKIG